MDSSNRDIEVVEDDMGEGYMDPIEPYEGDFDREQRQLWKLEEKLRRKQKNPSVRQEKIDEHKSKHK